MDVTLIYCIDLSTNKHTSTEITRLQKSFVRSHDGNHLRQHVLEFGTVIIGTVVVFATYLYHSSRGGNLAFTLGFVVPGTYPQCFILHFLVHRVGVVLEDDLRVLLPYIEKYGT